MIEMKKKGMCGMRSFRTSDGKCFFYYEGKLIPANRRDERFRRFYYKLHGELVTSGISKHDRAQIMIYEAEDIALPAKIVGNQYYDVATGNLYFRTANGIARIDSNGEVEVRPDFVEDESRAFLPGACFGDPPVFDPKMKPESAIAVIAEAFHSVASNFALRPFD